MRKMVVSFDGERPVIDAQVRHLPQQRRCETLVSVDYATVCLNDVLTANAAGSIVPGRMCVAGTVSKAATGACGPSVGASVVGVVFGAGWSDMASVTTDALAEVPQTLPSIEAIKIALCGLHAQAVLSDLGLLFGARVLVIGAESATGQMLCQLAVSQGAEVFATVKLGKHVRDIKNLGVEQVTAISAPELGVTGQTPFDFILEVDPAQSRALEIDTVTTNTRVSNGNKMTAENDIKMLERFRHVGSGIGFPECSLAASFKGQSIAVMLARLLRRAEMGLLFAPACPLISWQDLGRLVSGQCDALPEQAIISMSN